MMKRLVLRWLFGAQPAASAPIVHRGERELTRGADLGVRSSPTAKLSYDEALRCFGVHQGR